MSLVLLVRHGQASFGAADYDRLSALGVEQSRLVGASLAARGVRPGVVLRGSLRRHRETAEAAVAAAGWAVDVAEDAGWDEFDHTTTVGGPPMSFEALEGETADEQVARFRATVDRWASGAHDDEYAESLPAFQARVHDALDRLLATLGPRETAVVFTSGGPVSSVAARLLDAGPATRSRLADVVVNSAVSKVLVGRSGTRLVTFNDHAHLEADPTLITYR